MSPVLAPCPHRPPCPGCPRYGEPGPGTDAETSLAELCRAAGLPPPKVVEGPWAGYRHRARLSVRGRSRSPKVGLFQSGSHRIVDIPRCGVHHPRINEVAGALRQAIRETGATPYADLPHRGDLRGVQLVVERRSQRVQTVLIGNATDPGPLRPTLDALARYAGDALHSLWWNGNPDRTNVILGSRWEPIQGPETVSETIEGVEIFYPPGAFGQGNLILADTLIAAVSAAVPDGERVVEYYSGCGAIGLGLLGRSAAVTFNESSPHGLRGLELGLSALPPAERARAEILPGNAADHGNSIDAADTVIVDPPRKGLDAPLLDRLAAAPPARVVYVSCDLASFIRDTHGLLGAGRLRLTALTPFALFPFTPRIETLGVFERV